MEEERRGRVRSRWPLFIIEIACERAGLDLDEIQTILRCVRYHLDHGMEPGRPEQMLRGAIGRCWGTDDCDLCLRALKQMEELKKGRGLARYRA